MKKEITSQQIINKGGRAKVLLDDPVLKEAINDMAQALFDNFRTSAWHNFKERKEIYRQIKVVDGFSKRLEKFIKDGRDTQAINEQKVRNIV